ncbi:7566_t:CDS:2, partial [Dentiscutata heterogama]
RKSTLFCFAPSLRLRQKMNSRKNHHSHSRSSSYSSFDSPSCSPSPQGHMSVLGLGMLKKSIERRSQVTLLEERLEYLEKSQSNISQSSA